MTSFKTAIKLLLVVGVLAGIIAFVISNWGWVFSKRVKGEIINVERVTDPQAIFSSRASDAQIHSYSILIHSEDGRLYTASSEDRQWQVAKKGFCVEALLYRYPPWRLSLAGTYYNARLLELSNCPGKPLPEITPTPEVQVPPPAVPPSIPPSGAGTNE